VDLEDVVLPEAMQRAMARYAELRGAPQTERIQPDTVADVAHQVEVTGKILAGQPREVQIRFLQALNDLRSSDSTVVVVPLPIDLVQPFIDLQGRALPALHAPDDEGSSAETQALGQGQQS
jgi:hypothetical protein